MKLAKVILNYMETNLTVFDNILGR